MIDTTIDTSFLGKVFNQLNEVNISTLEYRLIGGLGEYLLIISQIEEFLDSSLIGRKKEEVFNRINTYYQHLNQESQHIPNDDELGMLLSIGYVFSKSDLFNQSYFINFVGRILNSHFHYPLKLKSLYYPGLLALLFWQNEDSLFRYSCEEKMLLLLRDCENIVEKNLNYQTEVSYGILHSILYFVQKCRDNRIGTYKSQILIDKISQMIGIPNEGYRLLDYLVRQDALTNLPHCNDDDIIGFMGLFSMLYNRPNPLFLEREYDVMISYAPSHQLYLQIVGGHILGLLKNFTH